MAVRNLTQTPQDKARMELNTVNLQLMWVIAHANRWHEIAKAADAMFHARLVWERCYKDLFEQQAEGAALSAAVLASRAQPEAEDK